MRVRTITSPSFILLAASLALAGCGKTDQSVRGMAGAPCYADNLCNAGLTCIANLCIPTDGGMLPSDAAGNDGATDAATDGHADAGADAATDAVSDTGAATDGGDASADGATGDAHDAATTDGSPSDGGAGDTSASDGGASDGGTDVPATTDGGADAQEDGAADTGPAG
jgi:hypothetical protein